MAVSCDWPSGVIFVPKADLTPLGGSLYELDADWLRLSLKDLEDDEAGIVWPKTHNHNPPVMLGGVTFARQIEILAPYTLTFEDGIYGVNVVGANTNLADVLNRNSVSVATANSAGLITVAGGAGETDWTALERAQIRHRLGIDGATDPPSATPSLATPADAEAYRVVAGLVYVAAARVVDGNVWLERNGQHVDAVTSILACFYDAAGLMLFALTDATPDGDGVFRLTSDPDPPGIAAGSAVHVRLTLTAPSGTFVSMKGLQVVA